MLIFVFISKHVPLPTVPSLLSWPIQHPSTFSNFPELFIYSSLKNYVDLKSTIIIFPISDPTFPI